MARVFDEYSDDHVCIVGLGYVGLTLAVAMAEVGFKVTGVERRSDIVESLVNGKPHFHEPKLPETLQRMRASGKITICDSIPLDTEASVFVVTVGTPLGSDGRVRLDMVEDAVREVSEVMGEGSLIVMRSTLKLGTTSNVVKPILIDSGKQFDLAFCPERTVEGRALSELRYLPQIVGGVTNSSALRAANMFQFLTPTVVRVSAPETAEMIKMIDNTYRDVMFAFSNEIAATCDSVEVSAVEVIRSAGLGYPRTNLHMPGPVGGPCLSKDPHILFEGLSEESHDMTIARSARALNENQPKMIADLICSLRRDLTCPNSTPKVALMGIAFKGRPATDDLRGTMAAPIFTQIKQRIPNGVFYGYDPMVESADLVEFGLTPCDFISEAFDQADLVVILNNHIDFQNMPLADLILKMKTPSLVYDLWNNFEASDLNITDGRGYAGLGNLAHAIVS